MMKAIVLNEFGGPSALQLADHPTPKTAPKEVYIKIKAAGVNRPDIAQREGRYPAPEGAPQKIPGLEVAGIVEAIGEEVTQWQVGDEVFGLLGGGGYAEYVTLHEEMCLPKPKNLSFVEAASLPETVFTVYHNLFQRGQVQKEENVLIHGGSSGIGITAIQLATLAGANVFVTVGNEEKQKTCLNLGAKKAINYKKEDFSEVLKEIGIDVVLDMIGGDYFRKNFDLMNPEGRMVYINTMLGPIVDLHLFKMMQKRLTITGSTLRARELPFKIALTKAIKEEVLPLIETREFKPLIYQTFPLKEAALAHELMESSQHIGKIMLEIN